MAFSNYLLKCFIHSDEGYSKETSVENAISVGIPIHYDAASFAGSRAFAPVNPS
jgi:hypothetical protein